VKQDAEKNILLKTQLYLLIDTHVLSLSSFSFIFFLISYFELYDFFFILTHFIEVLA
jgi:hypothetical protein